MRFWGGLRETRSAAAQLARLTRHQGLVEVVELRLGMKVKSYSPSTLAELNFGPSFPELFEFPFGGQDVRVFSWPRRRRGLLEILDAAFHLPD